MSAVIGSTAHVPTANASRYLQQLCKHWAHNLTVEFTPTRSTVVFPKDARSAGWPGDGLVTMIAQAESLECRIDASAAGQLEGLKGALARHLDRFAFREAPLRFDWADGRDSMPPLPWGEGWGEGEGRLEHPSSPTKLPRVMGRVPARRERGCHPP